MSIKDEKRAKAKSLIALSLNDAATTEERSTAAIRAIKIIQKYKLLDPAPLDGILENETFRAAKTVADKLADPELMGGLKELLKQGAAAVSAAKRRR
jgi:hypothetical protein